MPASTSRPRIPKQRPSYAFITGEVLQWIYRAREPEFVNPAGTNHGYERTNSAYVFPGNTNVGPTAFGFRGKKGDKPLSRNAASETLQILFSHAELTMSEDEVFTCHAMRTFADNQMAKCGFDRKFIAAIFGHVSKLAAEAHYIDWQEVEAQWMDHCLEHFTWNIHKPTVQIFKAANPQQEEIDGLKKIVLQLAKRLYGEGTATEMQAILPGLQDRLE